MKLWIDKIFQITVALLSLIMLAVVYEISYAAAPPPRAPVVTLILESNGALLFKWKKVKGASYYRLMQDRDENGNYKQIGPNISGVSKRYKASKRQSAFNKEPQYRIDACNSSGCTPSNVTSEAQVKLLNTPMNKDMKKAFDELLGGGEKHK